MKPSLSLAGSLWLWLVVLSPHILVLWLLALLPVLAIHLRILRLRFLLLLVLLRVLVLFGLLLFIVLLFILLRIPEVVIWGSPVRSCHMISGYDRSFAS